MWGKGLPGMGFGGCEASDVAGWLTERSSVGAFSSLTINKDLNFLRTDRHTTRCTRTGLSTPVMWFWCSIWLQLANRETGHLLDESSCWNSRNLTWDLFTKHISSPYSQHTTVHSQTKRREAERQRTHLLTVLINYPIGCLHITESFVLVRVHSQVHWKINAEHMRGEMEHGCTWSVGEFLVQKTENGPHTHIAKTLWSSLLKG